MIARLSAAAALTMGLSLGMPALAQPAAPELRPMVGLMSDEVALQRLRMAGVENPRVLRREGTDIVAQGTLQGRDTTLRLDAMQGRLVDTSAPTKALGGPGAVIEHPVVTGPQLNIPRAALSDPALMREATKPKP